APAAPAEWPQAAGSRLASRGARRALARGRGRQNTQHPILDLVRDPKISEEDLDGYVSFLDAGGHLQESDDFQRIIRQYVSKQRWSDAIYWLSEMLRLALQPKANLLSSCVRSCDAAGQWEHALAMEDEMTRTGVGLEDTYVPTTCWHAPPQDPSADMEAWKSAGDWPAVLALLEGLRRRGDVVLGTRECGAAAWACKNGDRRRRAEANYTKSENTQTQAIVATP
ncbi:unnamed protein product, partial [Prorocentrum cordatum]